MLLTHPPFLQRRALAVLGWVCLVLALLLAQTLGQLHRLKHLGSLQPQAVVSVLAGSHNSAHGFKSLFSTHDDGSPDCRLFDQLCLDGAATSVGALVLPILVLSQAVAIFAGDAIARWAALFDARGPPLTS